MRKIKVGSLFDGIGGTPLSAILSGAEPVWASEIEKVPISITKRHFPSMKHLGDITQINGAEIEPVDIIVGGSPCQDLSVAGKRAGLEGERSGLFMDQIRVIREMRNATRKQTGDGSDELPRPRYMVWENVPGAFSSNKGEDFRIVLEEVCRIGEKEVSIPRPPKGKWSKSGSILGDGYSVAWRTVDAQHWGVPQRRRRIYLVADFGGHTAPEICFEQESVSRDITAGGETGQRVAGDAEGSSGNTEPIVYMRGFGGRTSQDGTTPTLEAAAGMGGNNQPIVCYGLVSSGNGEAFLMEEKHMSLSCGGGQAGQGYPAIVERRTAGELVLNDQGGSVMGISYGVTGMLRAETHGHQPIVVHDCEPSTTYSLQGNMIGRKDENGPQGSGVNENVSFTLNTTDRHAVCYGISSYASNSMKSPNPNSGVYEADTSKTIDQNGGNPACNQGGLVVVEPMCFEPRSQDGVHRLHGDISPTLNTAQGGQRQPCVMSIDCRNLRETAVHGTLQSKENGGQSLNYSGAIRTGYTARRLTPLECERLQGYPDGWTALDHEDKAVSDTQRYKALGNSFAVPNAYFFINRCVQVLNGQDSSGASKTPRASNAAP